MLLWGVEAPDLHSLQLTCRFPCYDLWTKVSSQQPDILLTNTMAFIEASSSHCPQLPPRPRLCLPNVCRPATFPGPSAPATVGVVEHRGWSMHDKPPPPPAPAKSTRATNSNGRRHRKREEFQIQPTRVRCEVG